MAVSATAMIAIDDDLAIDITFITALLAGPTATGERMNII
jgi:hypothetical protein